MRLKNTVMPLLERGLASLGFRSAKPHILTRSISDDVVGWLGLVTTDIRHGWEVGPVAGLLNQRVERLVADLQETSWNEVSPPTLACNLGYLSPASTYMTYQFDVDGDHDVRVGELCADVRRHALPFMQRNAELGALVKTMQRGGAACSNASTQYRIPVGLFLLGDMAESRRAIEGTLASMQGQDPASAIYRRFATNLLKRLD